MSTGVGLGWMYERLDWWIINDGLLLISLYYLLLLTQIIKPKGI